MSNIRFRPHHFLCTVGFEGKGYSESFVDNYVRVAHGLRETPDGDQTAIEVTSGTDSICEPCPNRRDDRCETESKIRSLDEAHAKILGIRAGDRLTWGEAKEKIRTKMTVEKLRAACAPCAWLKAGMCERALVKLKGPAPAVSLLTAVFVGVIFFSSVHAHAEPVSDYEARRNALRVKIVGKKPKVSKSARALAKASNLLDAEKFSEAIAAAAPAEGDPEFADHALAIKGMASIRSGRRRRPEEKTGLEEDRSRLRALARRVVEDQGPVRLFALVGGRPEGNWKGRTRGSAREDQPEGE